MRSLRYSKEDIQVFINAQTWYHDGPAYSEAGLIVPVCIVAMKGRAQKLFKRDVKRIIKERSPVFSQELTKFLHDVPLDDVPLYINDYPNFVKWRLTIAK